MAAVLVGIDGSPGSQRALEWAAGEAKLRGADLHVVHAYRSEWVYYPEYAAVRTIVTPTNLEAEAKLVTERALDELGALGESLTITTETVNDTNAAHALLGRAGDAELIVVGSAGRTGLKRLLLGNTVEDVFDGSVAAVLGVRGTSREPLTSATISQV